MRTIISTVLLSAFLGLSGCAKNAQLEKRLENTEKDQAELKLRQAELGRQIEEISHTMMLMEDSLAGLLARQRQPEKKVVVKWHRPDPKEAESAQKPKKSKTKKKGESIFPVAPGDKNLPAITLTNDDLVRLDEKTSASKKVGTSKSVRSSVNRVEEDPRASDLYNQAYEKFEAGQHGQAIGELQVFVQEFPKHRYADNALYWIGESYYQEEAYLKALSQFERLVRDYPSANKVPDALLRAGACHLRLSNRGGAKKSFQELIQKYPRSIAAQKAQEFLAELRKSHEKRRM